MFRYLARAIVCLSAAAFLCLFVLSFFLISGTTVLEVTPTADPDGDPDCPWHIEGPSGRGCLAALDEIAIDRLAFNRDPQDRPEESAAWWEHQEALSRLEGRPAVAARLAGQEHAALIPLARERYTRYSILILGGLCATIWISVGVLLLFRRPEDASATSFSVLSAAAGLAIFATYYLRARGLGDAGLGAKAIVSANSLALVFIPPSIIYFGLNFPARIFAERSRYLVYALGALGLILCIQPGAWRPSVLLINIYFPFGTILGIAVIAYNAFRVKGAVYRLQVRWVVWSFVAALLPAVATPLLSGLGVSLPYSLTLVLALFTSIVPIGVSFSILKYRLFDIDLIIRRSLLGAVLFVPAVLVYFLALSFLGTSIFQGSDIPTPGVSFIGAVLLGLVFLPVQTRVEETFDRVFQRNSFSGRKRLLDMPDILSQLTEEDQIEAEVLKSLDGVFELKYGAFFAYDEFFVTWRKGETLGEFPEALFKIPEIGDAFLFGRPSLPEEIGIPPQALSLIIPVQAGQRPVGLLLLGPRSKSRLYRSTDLALLKTLAAAMGLALENARTYKRLASINEELEQKVEERTRELKNAQVQLVQQEKMTSLGLLVAGVAHELNTPLAAITANAELLSDAVEGAAAGDFEALEDIRALLRPTGSAARRASEIIRRLQSFSRLDEAKRKEIDITEGLDLTLGLLGARLDEIRVRRDYAPDTPLVECYPGPLNQVFLNLLVNAIDAMRGAGELFISAGPAQGGERVRVAIRDSGPGVEPDLLARIFDPFFTTKPPGQGTGLGLSISYNIIRRHGGKLRAESPPGQGATFIVEIPTVLPELPPEGEFDLPLQIDLSSEEEDG
jgi:signal transduction histidine kinase